MELSLEIGAYSFTIGWYLIMGVIIVAVSTFASIYHGKFSPAVWGWMMGLILYLGYEYIEPVIFGWMGYQGSNTYLFALSLYMAILFLIQIAILLSNAIGKGEVWA